MVALRKSREQNRLPALQLIPEMQDSTMDVEIETVDDVTVVTLAGRLDSTTSRQVRDDVMPHAEQTTSILLDMRQVRYMSSAGLRMLLSLHRTVDARGGSVVLVGLAETLQEVMSITGFLGFFTISDTREDGMATLKN